MDTYSLFRQIADSWVLLALFVFFISCILWAWRPGSRAQHQEASALIFRDEKTGCARECATCDCKPKLDMPHDNA
ncbi:cbb3-type cytochrome c oxidase subunit 3 [Puniceibacterium confluentis]|uniref:cbb3-type cytochrome c oxidase subunit 3 n=1 Tax=Puniceibacterium confluentis TaxID=1958944 RepID=UPI0011B4F55A|nr:cbb3-type cytochrome c oxidase subunit 3 [Puniceibacterium confluentis]